jgi:hypothetical protein
MATTAAATTDTRTRDLIYGVTNQILGLPDVAALATIDQLQAALDDLAMTFRQPTNIDPLF